MLRVKVWPPKDYFYSFLNTRGLLLVEDKPQILHFVKGKEKELKTLLKEDKPDLLINHAFPSFNLKIFQVYHPVQNEVELSMPKKIWTNRFSLCKTYYQRLGIQTEIEIIPGKKSISESKSLVSFQLSKWNLFNIIDNYWRRFKSWMLWN